MTSKIEYNVKNNVKCQYAGISAIDKMIDKLTELKNNPDIACMRSISLRIATDESDTKADRLLRSVSVEVVDKESIKEAILKICKKYAGKEMLSGEMVDFEVGMSQIVGMLMDTTDTNKNYTCEEINEIWKQHGIPYAIQFIKFATYGITELK